MTKTTPPMPTNPSPALITALDALSQAEQVYLIPEKDLAKKIAKSPVRFDQIGKVEQ
ncbi:MAG: hypothetical protein KJ731_16430 [Alphaproteobacteria bacterium]|nr:hypothetical protein [Alphaproteobacteria bacterium]MBU1278482.1 hypothetical protein [Alphaproteobacteria bacterium]MBU1573335.1 hypothetical protein [Alphaproteobacteria bacterium]MBU1830035.1 hypothetical protein [Alphaproteobacteria bacterium]MBU2241226.1 hypothetical protein [Alphaproteobacteria bacterium]